MSWAERFYVSPGYAIKIALFIVVVLLLLGVGNFLGVVERLYHEMLSLPDKWLVLTIVVALIWFSRRWLPLFFTLLTLAVLCLTGLVAPLQHSIQGLSGFRTTPPVSRFYCSDRMAPRTEQLYRVEHQATGVQTLLLLGQSYTQKPVMCAATPEYFPVISLASLEHHEQLDLSQEGNLEKVMQDSSAMMTQSNGHITFMFIPSLKTTTYRLPFVVRNRQLLLMPGDSRLTGVTVSRLF